jgi:hypothetical protein
MQPMRLWVQQVILPCWARLGLGLLPFVFLSDTRAANPSPAGHTQLSRVTPTAGGRRLSLTDEGRLTHLITGGAQHLDQTRMGLEPIHPLRVLDLSLSS